mmetsp:Transcript_3519/g.8466  ORF Transcript_3519/g.8466 Transcript_3519/m.8466 type:complete len:231 (+) Transcript_3519:659-1351(+)
MPENQDHDHRHDEGPQHRAESRSDSNDGGYGGKDHGQACSGRQDACRVHHAHGAAHRSSCAMCSRNRNRLEGPRPPQQHEHAVPAEAGQGLEKRSPGPEDLWELISGWLHTQGKGNKQGAACQELCQGCRSVILGVGQKDVLRGCGSMGDDSARRHYCIHHRECCARPKKNLVDSATVRVVKLPVYGNRHMLAVQGAKNDRPSLGENMQRARPSAVHDDLHMLIARLWAT